MKLDLRGRLLVSYIALVVCFCSTFAVLYAVQADPLPALAFHPAPLDRPIGRLDPPGPSIWRTLEVHPEPAARNGVPGLLRELRGQVARWPPEAWVTLLEPEGRAHLVQGPETFGRPEDVARALAGLGLHQVSELGGHSHMEPLYGPDGKVVAVLAVEWGHRNGRLRGHQLFWRELRRGLVSLVGASCLSLGLGFLFSDRISRPLRQLAANLQSMDAERLVDLPPAATGELSLVAEAFNGLVERLQHSMYQLRAQTERSRHAEASRRDFMADVSHNLRTPLTAITGWLDALQDGMEVDVGRVALEVEHVVRMIGRLHELARWEQDLPRLRRETFVLLDVVLEVAQTLEEAARRAEIQLVFESVNPTWTVRADRVRIRELFQIFLENAVHHAGPGSTVSLAMALEPGKVRVDVRDDGRGLDPARLGQRAQGGTGLGLAIARKLVEAHGGPLEVTSSPGQGSRFRFWLEQI